ncbi:MAG: hypothetical protein GX297_06565 [Treponema sp.]|jgi:2-succinyl-5-enolpyruvyl-6-hydroxy-3-cyclohexene-1-carboxylate synthase|nr:hypothetical protein [Treponema sp.]
MEGVYFSAVILIINVILWLYFYYKFKKTYSPEKVLKKIRIELDKLFKEIVREAEEDVSIIEGRIQGLKSLIAEADERILRAENESAKRSREKQVLADLEFVNQGERKQKTPVQKKLSQYEQTAFPISTEKQAEVQSVVDNDVEKVTNSDVLLEFNSFENQLEQDVEINVSQELISKSKEEFQKPKQEKIEIVLSKNAITQKKSSKEQILELYKLDISSDKISEMLNIPLNEVQLAINLFACAR